MNDAVARMKAGGIDVSGFEATPPPTGASQEGTPGATPGEAQPPAGDPPLSAEIPPVEAGKETPGAPPAGDPPAAAPAVSATVVEPPAIQPPAQHPDVLAALREKGISVDSVDDLVARLNKTAPTAQELAEAEQVLADNAIKFGIEKQIFNTKQLEAFNIDKNKTPQDIAYALFAKQQLAGDSTLTPEQIGERFSEHYLLDVADDDPSAWRKKIMQDEMNRIADQHIKGNYGDILNVTEAYKQDQVISQKAKGYKAMVEDVMTNFPKHMTSPVKDDEGEYNYNFEIHPDVINKVKEDYLTPETFMALNRGEITKDELISTVNLAILKEVESKRIETVAKAYHAQKMEAFLATRSGVPFPTGQDGSPLGTQEPKQGTIAEGRMKKAGYQVTT